MTYRGRVQNGVVVFDEPVSLGEGTAVRVEPLADEGESPARGSPEALRDFTDRWAGDPAELDDLLAEVQRLRDADLTPVDES
jgi:hypothetical protein